MTIEELNQLVGKIKALKLAIAKHCNNRHITEETILDFWLYKNNQHFDINYIEIPQYSEIKIHEETLTREDIEQIIKDL